LLSNLSNFDCPDKLVHLTIPIEVIEDVFVDYSLLDQRVMLWKLIHVVLVTDNEEYKEPYARDSLLYQCKRLEELLEAAWLIIEDNALPKKDCTEDKVMPSGD